MLELRDRLRIEQMIFAVGAEVVAASDTQLRLRFCRSAECMGMLHDGFASQHVKADTLKLGRSADKVFLDQLFV